MNKNMTQRVALASAIGCMVIWPCLTVYWKALIPISSWVIILYRIFLVFVSSIIMAKFSYSWKEILAPLKDRKQLLMYLFSGIMITVNWSIYIWAVNSEHVIEASLGYYIEPLAIVVFGVVIFHERFTKYNSIAVGLATLSVIIILVHYRAIPGISLGLALTFAIYSAIKKKSTAPALISLIYETIFIAPIALIAVIYLETSGEGAFAVASYWQIALLMLCGFATAIPLAMYSKAAQKLSLFTVGLVEYISPTLSMLFGIFLFKEPIDGVMLLAFAIIWAGLAVFTYGGFVESRVKPAEGEYYGELS